MILLHFLQLRCHAAMKEVEQSFICGHAAMLPRSENFEKDTLSRKRF